jgi:hypothetical protein
MVCGPTIAEVTAGWLTTKAIDALAPAGGGQPLLIAAM